jgi:hypothetical protein
MTKMWCDICDATLPPPMLSDGICAACWSEHGEELRREGSALLSAWADGHAKRARGPLLLASATP